MELLRLSLKRKVVPVILETEEGVEKNYLLKELTGSERDRYLNQMSGKMKFGPGGKPTGVRSFDGLQASLLALCLYEESGELVSEKVIQGFPATALSALFEQAQEISALNVAGADAAKND